MSAIFGFVESFDFASANVHRLNARAVEARAGRIGADVVGDPLAIRRPDAGIGQEMGMRRMRDLLLARGGVCVG